MAYQRYKSANFGSSKAALSNVGYALYNPDGSLNTARTTTGVVERGTGTGIYGALITFPAGFVGELRWDTGDAAPIFASEDINPGASEYIDGAISGIPASIDATPLPNNPTPGTWGDAIVTDHAMNVAFAARGTVNDSSPTSTSFVTTGLSGVAGDYVGRTLATGTVGNQAVVSAYDGSRITLETALMTVPANGAQVLIL
ncbi:MAG: hypothetical protein KGL39_39260 [Patescibacteria group bacterium]|nr:hypothetical protein [Patescibacteria group bacterium]